MKLSTDTLDALQQLTSKRWTHWNPGPLDDSGMDATYECTILAGNGVVVRHFISLYHKTVLQVRYTLTIEKNLGTIVLFNTTRECTSEDDILCLARHALYSFDDFQTAINSIGNAP